MTKIAIDSGHGSNTPGKRTPDGYREHYGNTYVAYYLDQILTKNGFETYKSSWDDADAHDDSDVSLTNRQKNIKSAKCDISVSIHLNASGDGNSYNSAQGVETYYHSTYAKSGDSKKLATVVHNQLIKGTPQKNRGIKTAAFAMCNCSALGVKAAILVELAFMTNEAESKLIKNDSFLRECAREIAQGIFDYYGVKGNVNVDLVSLDGKTTTTTPTTKPSTSTPSTSDSTVKLTTGAAFKLSNVTFYATSKATTGVKKSGTFYIWSPTKYSGRVRVTNSKDKVGVAGQVSGWVNVSDLGNTTSNTTKTEATAPVNPIKKGNSFKLTNVFFYANAKAVSGIKKTGTFYVWDELVNSGRVRMTNSKERVGVAGQVSGWVNVSDLK